MLSNKHHHSYSLMLVPTCSAMMRRQKRNPDSIQLNFVESLPKRRSVKIRRVSYSLAHKQPADRPCTSTPASSTPNPTAADAMAGCGEDPLPDDLQEPFSGDPSFFSQMNPCRMESHTERKKRTAEAWEEIRPKLIPAMISSVGFPSGIACVICKSSANVWCKDCGALAYLCEECARKLHTDVNIFHSPMLWKVRHFIIIYCTL